MKIELCEGKYEWVFDNSTGEQYCLRYGVAWRNLAGDNLTLSMGTSIKELEHQVNMLNEEITALNNRLYELKA
jgi:hypothetical protein